MSGWWPRGRWRSFSRGRLPEHLLVLAGLVAFVGAVYVAVVIVVGLFVGRSDAPSTAAVGGRHGDRRGGVRTCRDGDCRRGRTAYRVVRTRCRTTCSPISHRTAGRRRRRRRCGWRKFSLRGWVPAGSRCGCWPVVESGLLRSTPRATASLPAPPELTDDPRPAPGRHVRPVRHSGELLGVLVVEEREGERLTPVEEELLDSLAAQAGLVLRNLGLTTELHDQLLAVSARADLLRTSRRRVVASEDVERQLLERDIHDGAQQQLVALAVNIRLVQNLLTRSPHRAGELLKGLDRSVEQAAADLLEVVGGRPRLLAQAGLTAALRSAAGTSALPVELVSSGLRTILSRRGARPVLLLHGGVAERCQACRGSCGGDRASRRRAERHRVCQR